MKKRFLLAAPAALAVAATMAISPASVAVASPLYSVVINEVESNDDPVGDWFEVANTGEIAIDISGWSYVDNATDHTPQVIPAGTVLEAGQYLSFYTDADPVHGFGLGKNDSVTLFNAEGAVVDVVEWSGHAATTWGRVPDMTGDFAVTGAATRNAANTASASSHPVVINEVESNGDPVDDWIELANTDTVNSFDISGWSFVDNDPEHAPYIFPAGTVIESGGYISFYTGQTGNFGLGGNDSVTLFDAEGTVVDFTEWSGHAATTWGRIPDMTGQFAETGAPTRNGINMAAGVQESLTNAELPFHTIEIRDLEPGSDFAVEDMSGADFDTAGRAWIVNNDAGDIYALDHDVDTDTYTPAGHWQVTYPGGIGTPDGEGITIAADGSIYLATERNNDDKSTSRPSILRFDAPTTSTGRLTATHEWNLAEFTGPIGANAGLETIEHLEGTIFAVGVEGTGEIIVVDLADEIPIRIQTVQSPFQGVMALDYNAETKQLHLWCDEVCEGASQFLTWTGTALTATDDNIYARPVNLGNFANEGFASYTAEGECIDGDKSTYTTYLWADDSVNGGISIRTAREIVQATGCDTNVPDQVEDEVGQDLAGNGKNNGSSDFAAGSIVGSVATGILGIVSILGVLGGILQQMLAAFPALKQYIRF